MLNILIPTLKPEADASLVRMVAEIATTTYTLGPPHIVMSCRKGSAAENRNWCLRQLPPEGCLAIMLDDDIEGFYPGWDRDLLAPLEADPEAVIVTARLMTPDGRLAQTCTDDYDLSRDVAEVKPAQVSVLPTAAIAFRWLPGPWFDEGFLGSGFEDGDWCFQYRQQRPNAKFLQSNVCRLVHRNEMKNQSRYWDHNLLHFVRKWKIGVSATP